MTVEVEPGELVRMSVVVRVVRVDRVGASAFGVLQYGGAAGQRFAVDLEHHAVSLTRVAPAQWPPIAGDVWQDRGGVEWFCRLVYDDEVWSAELVCAAEGKVYREDPDDAAERFGPMRLLRRRGWAPPGELAPPGDLEQPIPPGQMSTVVDAARRDAGLPVAVVQKLENGELVLSFAEGQRGAVDEWAEYLGAPAPQLVGLGSEIEPWHSYCATGARWRGWDVRVWCSVQSQPVVPAGGEPAGIDDPALADRLRAARVQEARAELAGLTGMPQEQADWDGDVEDVTGPALTDADATGELAQIENAHQDLATTEAYAAGRATLQEWLGPDAEPEETGPVWDGPGPIGDHDA